MGAIRRGGGVPIAGALLGMTFLNQLADFFDLSRLFCQPKPGSRHLNQRNPRLIGFNSARDFQAFSRETPITRALS
jgi:hypothetical protein